jgi:hypothetical protein
MEVTEKSQKELAKMGRKILSGKKEEVSKLEVLGEKMENSRRKTMIIKTYEAYHAYGDMLHIYAVRNLMAYLNQDPGNTLKSMNNDLKGKRQKEWINLGGQIMQKKDLDQLRLDIGSGKLTSWNDIHNRYNKLWAKYPFDKQKHAFAVLCDLLETDKLTDIQWDSALEKSVDIQKYISDQVYISRKKDYDNPYRQATFRNMDEMQAAIGNIDENSFILQIRQETEDFRNQVKEIRSRI